MALAFTTRGTGGDNSSGTSTAIVPTVSLTPATTGVLCIALDNAGNQGSTAAAPAGPITDTAGNVWTRRVDGIYDNGAASAGVEVAIYTAYLGGIGFRTTDSLTLSWIAGVSVTAKAWTIQECSAASGKIGTFATGAAGTGATTGAPTVTTSSIASGDAVIGVAGLEGADSWTGDADTSNGNWAAQQHTAFGTGTSGMAVTSQTKVTTGTATQTYNPTCTSGDTMIAWISMTESTLPKVQSYDQSSQRVPSNEAKIARDSFYPENLRLTLLAPQIPTGQQLQIPPPVPSRPRLISNDIPNILFTTLADVDFNYQFRDPIMQRVRQYGKLIIDQFPNLIMTTLTPVDTNTYIFRDPIVQGQYRAFRPTIDYFQNFLPLRSVSATSIVPILMHGYRQRRTA